MKQYAEHDKVGLCHALRKDDLYVRAFSGGYPYLKNGAIVRSTSLNPVYSYGKNYTKNKKKFAMFVWTTNKNADEVEKMFESLLSDVTKDQVSQVLGEGSFVYLG